MITLLFFAGVAERVKARSLHMPLAATPQALVEGQAALGFLKDRSARVAVNRQWAHWDTPLSEGDEVAFMPSPGIL
jgi:molybdopterin converting factor small subunit